MGCLASSQPSLHVDYHWNEKSDRLEEIPSPKKANKPKWFL
jgi:hypothetical protein